MVDYKFNQKRLFSMVFTMIPTHIIKEACDSLFIGGSQGVKNKRDEWKLATKTNSRISPDEMLIIALQAWASKNNILRILAVDVENQIAKSLNGNRPDYSLTYDTLWANSGGDKKQNYYVLPNLPFIKDRSEKNNYRSRDKKQDALRLEIFEEIKNNLTQFLV